MTRNTPEMASVFEEILQWLNSLASDLDIVLNDLCRGNFPYSGVGPPRITSSRPRRPYQPMGEDPVLEQYIASAATLVDDDDLSGEDVFGERSDSDISSDGEFFSLDEEQSSDGAVAGSDVDSPTPFLPASSPSDSGGGTRVGTRPQSPPITALSLVERLTRTHPIWYLPNIQRKDCSLLLCDREEGIFLVRQASERNKMVLSIRTGSKPNIEHFLIETTSKGLKLKGCFRTFDDVTKLITHYSLNRDGLPVLLSLPRVIMQAQTQQELSSLALLGQDFWTSSISRTPAVMRTVFHTNVSSYTGSPSPAKAHSSNSRARQGDNHQVSAPVHRNSHVPSTGKPKFETTSGVHRAPSLENFSPPNRKKSSSFAALSKITGNQSRVPTRNLSNDALVGSTNGYSPYQLDQNGALTKFKEYNSSSLTNHSRERSAFQTPPIAVGESVVKENTYNSGDLDDKLSDYEDAQGPFFRPIVQSETEGTSGNNTPKQRKKGRANCARNGVKNPGYDTDGLSDKSDFIDSNFFIDIDKQKMCKRLISTEHVEETRTEHVKRVVPENLKKSKPVVFTFNVLPSTPTDTMVAPPALAKSSIYIPLSPPHRGPCLSTTSSQYSSPAYIEPYDSLVGKVEGASQTRPVVRVNNVLKQNGNHSSVDKPPMSPPHHKDEFKSSTLPTFRSCKTEVLYRPHLARPVTNSGLWQRRKVSAPAVTGNRSTFNGIKGPSTADFNRSQSLRNLPSNGSMKDFRAQCQPHHSQDLKENQRHRFNLNQLQAVKEPVSSCSAQVSSHSPPQKHHPLHRSQPQVSSASGSPTSSLNAQTKAMHDAKLSAVNDIVGDLEKLNTLIDTQTVTLRRFPRAVSQTSLNSTQTSFSDTCTVDEFLNNVSPELTLKPIKPLTVKNLQRMSDYDNLSVPGAGTPSRKTVVSSVGTQYCMPWDSNFLQDLVTLGSVAQHGKFPSTAGLRNSDNLNRDSFVSRQSAITDYSLYNESESGRAPSESSYDMVPRPDAPLAGSANPVPVHVSDDEGMEDDLDVGRVRPHQEIEPLIAPSQATGVRSNHANRNKTNFPGIKVRDYVSDLAQDRMTTFGKTVDNFICCTKEGSENNPHVVIRNVRQFMNGIKNYLCQNGEGDLNQIIEQERKTLGDNEFLNIDALLEGSLHKCVVKPLEGHLLGLFIEEYRRNGSLQHMKENIEYARTKSPYELGIKPDLLPPETRSLEKVKSSLHRMQKAYSPLKKLHHLLTATADIYTLIQEMEDCETASSTNSTVSLGADDFLPMFIYILVQCGMVSAEIEADYMWGLLHPSILAGEGGYHLTILSSAVHVLKHLRSTMESTNDSPRLPSLGDLQGFMKIIIPEEKNHSIITKILPVRPNMTTRDVCNMIAHRFKVTNPQDHGLYLLISGISTAEDRLSDTDCPQSMKENILKDGRECVFAYKRINAKFVWPVIFKP